MWARGGWGGGFHVICVGGGTVGARGGYRDPWGGADGICGPDPSLRGLAALAWAGEQRATGANVADQRWHSDQYFCLTLF